MPPLTPGRRWRCNSPWIPFRWPSTRRRAGGYDRIMRITHNWVAVQHEYKPALDCRNPEADVRQEHMDRVLAEIIRDRMTLIRFPERYPNAKKIKYGR